MPRSTNNVASRQRRKKVLKRAKGNYSGRRKLFQNAKETVIRGDVYAYRDRKRRKREFRSMWIARLNAAVRQRGVTYSRFIDGLKRAGIDLDRKSLSEVAIADPSTFDLFVSKAKSALEAAAA
jgi:large subunit ribosomal protein L20